MRDAAQAFEAKLSAETWKSSAADAVVIGAPMYNFTVPTQLKARIDRVAVAGKTFRYTEAGPEGLCGNKKVVLVSTAGGLHAGQPTGAGHEDFLKVFWASSVSPTRKSSVPMARPMALSTAARRSMLPGRRLRTSCLLLPDPAVLRKPQRLARTLWERPQATGIAGSAAASAVARSAAGG